MNKTFEGFENGPLKTWKDCFEKYRLNFTSILFCAMNVCKYPSENCFQFRRNLTLFLASPVGNNLVFEFIMIILLTCP